MRTILRHEAAPDMGIAFPVVRPLRLFAANLPILFP